MNVSRRRLKASAIFNEVSKYITSLNVKGVNVVEGHHGAPRISWSFKNKSLSRALLNPRSRIAYQTLENN